jgi:hypothetical protein
MLMLLVGIGAMLGLFFLVLAVHQMTMGTYRARLVSGTGSRFMIHHFLVVAAQIGCVALLVHWLYRASIENDRFYVLQVFQGFQVEVTNGLDETAFGRMSPIYRANHSLEEFLSIATLVRETNCLLDHTFSITMNGSRAFLKPRSDVKECPEYGFERIEGRWWLTGDVRYYQPW